MKKTDCYNLVWLLGFQTLILGKEGTYGIVQAGIFVILSLLYIEMKFK